MKTELVKIETLVFDPANARKHGEKNLAAIKSSLQRFGQQKPIVVDANGVVRAGNGTLAAAKALGWKEIAIVRSPLSGSEATAYAIADNRSSELAEWDDDVLSQTLAAIQIEDEDLALATGFDAKEIDALLAPDEVKEDEVPEPPVDPITKTGDLWILGDHRLLCGDSTKAEDVERLMNGANERRVHPTQKPIRLLRSIVEDYSEGAIVDLILGSGTTLLAAEMLGRKCYGMEISPQCCDVIVKRWENLTGKKAVLATR